MTIKEIAEKYGVSYNVAYQATYGVKPMTGQIRDREYPEGPVVENIKAYLMERVKKHLEKARELNDTLKMVCEIAE
jgi:hypothetical protein